ncbi:hypothetical protein [Helicobacter salomonis]|uniref:hypothetical protein n=1 Tax=Helicobacter salomonis TaxID=56878 RepID=UPI001B341DD9|nr:hypothetical protein [Helicobacter salomonis]
MSLTNQQCKNFLKRVIPRSWHQSLKHAYGLALSLPSLSFYYHPQKQKVFAKITPLKNEDYIRANRLCGGGGELYPFF